MNETNHNQAAPAPATDEREAFEAWASTRYALAKDWWPVWKASRAALAATPAPFASAAFRDDEKVPVPRSLLGAACNAIDKKRDAPRTLAELRRYTTGDLSEAAATAATAPVVLPEPDDIYRGTCADGTRCLHGCHKNDPCHTVRALLATATGLPAQAVAYIDSEVLTSFLSSSNYRPADGWDCHIRHQENKRDTDVPLYSRPQAQADARDAESDYQRGYRHGYNRRDAEVQGALL